jgi:hypothetical protein
VPKPFCSMVLVRAILESLEVPVGNA